MVQDPSEAQTGPARRNDNIVVNEHLNMLKEKNTLLCIKL